MVVVGLGELIFHERGFVVVVSAGRSSPTHPPGGVHDVCGGARSSIDVPEHQFELVMRVV